MLFLIQVFMAEANDLKIVSTSMPRLEDHAVIIYEDGEEADDGSDTTSVHMIPLTSITRIKVSSCQK
jgi:hypothetical protein